MQAQVWWVLMVPGTSSLPEQNETERKKCRASLDKMESIRVVILFIYLFTFQHFPSDFKGSTLCIRDRGKQSLLHRHNSLAHTCCGQDPSHFRQISGISESRISLPWSFLYFPLGICPSRHHSEDEE